MLVRDRLIVTASVSAEKATIDASYEVAQDLPCKAYFIVILWQYTHDKMLSCFGELDLLCILIRHLDFINVMTYDFHDFSEGVTGHHSPLFKRSGETGDNVYLNAVSTGIHILPA